MRREAPLCHTLHPTPIQLPKDLRSEELEYKDEPEDTVNEIEDVSVEGTKKESGSCVNKESMVQA